MVACQGNSFGLRVEIGFGRAVACALWKPEIAGTSCGVYWDGSARAHEATAGSGRPSSVKQRSMYLDENCGRERARVCLNRIVCNPKEVRLQSLDKVVDQQEHAPKPKTLAPVRHD